MSTITFIWLVLGAFVLVGSGVVLRAFLRVRGEPQLIPPEGRSIRPESEPPSGLADAQERMDGAGAPHRPSGRPLTASPLDKPAMAILRNWYAGRECAVCRREIGPVQGLERRLGLLSVAAPAHAILTWEEIPTDQLPGLLESHLPVCAGCTLAESFRRQFPDRVTDRADTAARDRAFH